VNEKLLRFIKCPHCDAEQFALEVIKGKSNHEVITGRLTCTHCREWYMIENQITDLSPRHMRDNALYEQFSKKWNLDFARPSEYAHVSNNAQEQNNYFQRYSAAYDHQVANSVFYQASDRLCLYPWIRSIIPPKTIVDIGGGTGRQAIPIAERGNYVISFDISNEMLQLAQQKANTRNLSSSIDYIRADAHKFPLQSLSFDAAIAYGILHHALHPEKIIQETTAVLKKGGAWFSYDPHSSPLRFIFDIAMKCKKLYDEEGECRLLTAEDIRTWCSHAHIDVTVRYSCYVLPHIVNCCGLHCAYALLKSTDRLFSTLPFIRSLGGIIISEGIKSG
jgi:ubiquinone/menaquinone biosynthesis C-methylase UbiE/uncharacterized protein YbaR (Trm112 family)